MNQEVYGNIIIIVLWWSLDERTALLTVGPGNSSIVGYSVEALTPPVGRTRRDLALYSDPLKDSISLRLRRVCMHICMLSSCIINLSMVIGMSQSCIYRPPLLFQSSLLGCIIGVGGG